MILLKRVLKARRNFKDMNSSYLTKEEFRLWSGAMITNQVCQNRQMDALLSLQTPPLLTTAKKMKAS